MPLFLTEDDVAASLTMGEALQLLDDAARKLSSGAAMNAPRQRVSSGAAMLHVLPAALDGRVGHKAYTVGPRGARFWLTLYAPTGEMLAIIEANQLGQMRTGAASGLATRYLARTDAKRLGVIGTGFQAQTQIEAICLTRSIEQVRVWGRAAPRLRSFCQRLSDDLNRSIEPASSADDAVADADVVVTITSSAQPVFRGTSLLAGTHINAVGSNRATAQEIDVTTVQKATLVAVEDVAQAKIESGDLLAAVEAGVFAWSSAVRLADIIAGKRPGRTDDQQITLFESLGIGLWDIAVASHVYDRCVGSGRGRALPYSG